MCPYRKKIPTPLLVGVYMNTAIWESARRVPRQLKIDLLLDPTTPILGIYLKEAAQPTTAKTWK